MAGCAGMTLQQEPTPPKTVLNFLVTLTTQVCSEADMLLPSDDSFFYNALLYLFN